MCFITNRNIVENQKILHKKIKELFEIVEKQTEILKKIVDRLENKKEAENG